MPEPGPGPGAGTGARRDRCPPPRSPGAPPAPPVRSRPGPPPGARTPPRRPLPRAAPRGSPRASRSPRPPRRPRRGLPLSGAPLLPTAPPFPLRSSLSPLPRSAPRSPPSLGRFGQSHARCGPPPPFGPPLPWAPSPCQQHPRAVRSLPTTPLSLGFHSSSPSLPRGSPDPSTPLRLPPRVSPSWRHLTQQVICTIASEEPGAGSPVYTCGVFQEGYGGLTFHSNLSLITEDEAKYNQSYIETEPEVVIRPRGSGIQIFALETPLAARRGIACGRLRGIER
ncbi:basic proline-rich protein-like [Balaenoptera ricei]|uniref:basic proline-rich protein-like n=1 Tax=Balaenoptera ricei TaxID=2746895 RepID=UPI0028BF03F1|nr:basic proline-rich protein-like [Balaenoptera ricei]